MTSRNHELWAYIFQLHILKICPTWNFACIAKIITNKQKKNSVAFSPKPNYTDWATATYWRNLLTTFADRRLWRGQRGGSHTVVNLSFLDRSRYFSFKYLPIYPHKGWVDPVSDPLLFRKSGSVGNRTRDLWVCSQEVWLLDYRSGHFEDQPIIFITL
jgi:hypothetical protein